MANCIDPDHPILAASDLGLHCLIRPVSLNTSGTRIQYTQASFFIVMVFWIYGKCPKITNTKVSDKMPYANSAYPDQTALEGAI